MVDDCIVQRLSFLEIIIEVQIKCLLYSNSTVFANNQHELNFQLHVRNNGQFQTNPPFKNLQLLKMVI